MSHIINDKILEDLYEEAIALGLPHEAAIAYALEKFEELPMDRIKGLKRKRNYYGDEFLSNV
ncbi:MAG: hypothetical protein CM15mV144_010 [Caudoviricetes sp.]|nr:MAG: hypothetical protein CM15mV144_010 [Caudoviricetes sp.]